MRAARFDKADEAVGRLGEPRRRGASNPARSRQSKVHNQRFGGRKRARPCEQSESAATSDDADEAVEKKHDRRDPRTGASIQSTVRSPRSTIGGRKSAKPSRAVQAISDVRGCQPPAVREEITPSAAKEEGMAVNSIREGNQERGRWTSRSPRSRKTAQGEQPSPRSTVRAGKNARPSPAARASSDVRLCRRGGGEGDYVAPSGAK